MDGRELNSQALRFEVAPTCGSHPDFFSTPNLKKPMQRSKPTKLTVAMALVLAGVAHAKFTPIALNPASFNNDPVIEVGAPVAINTTINATIDGGTNKTGNTVYERGYNAAAPATGMPVAGSLVTDATLNHTFRMPPDYHANCAVMVGKNAGGGTPLLAGGTFTLTTPGTFSGLSFLAIAGNGPVLVGYRIRYADTSTEEGSFSVLDWFNSGVGVFTNSGRVSMDGGVQNVNGVSAAVVFAADIPVGNPAVNITSIDFFYVGSGANGNTNNNGRAAIFAVSGAKDFSLEFTNALVVTGFNYDPIVEADAPATTGAGRNTGGDGAFALTNHITLTMDGGTNLTGSTWYEKGYYSGLPTTGIPVAGGSVTSAWNNARYTMPASYVGNCAVMLAQHLNSANISFAAPAAYGAISLLAGVANGDTTLPVVINFQDGSSETNVVFVPDWHNRATPWAYLSGGRIAPIGRFVNNDAGRRTDPFVLPYPFSFDFRDIAGGLYVPRFHDCVINIANTSSAITNISLSFTNGANTRVVSIFAVSGAPVGGVPPVFGVNGSPRPGQPANAAANNVTLVKRWEGTNNVVLSVTNIAGSGPITYQWKKAPRGGGLRDLLYSFDYSTFANVVDGGRFSGATTSALVISNALTADSADYLVIASNASGSVTSHVATVMILTTNQSILVGTALGDTISAFAADPTPGAEGISQAIDRVAQKWLSFGILNNQLPFIGPVGFTVTPVSGASIVTSMRFFTANDDDNRDPMDYSLEGSNDGSTWTPITGGKLTGTLSLPTGRNSTGAATLNALNQNVIQVDFANAVGYNSYRVLVTNNVQSRLTGIMQIGEIELLGSLVPNPPVWVRQPDADATVYVGASPSFTVSASGNPQPRYQWYRGVTAIPGATSATYTFPNAQLVDSGSTFSAVATNSFGQIQSSSVTLSVIPAPTQSYPSAVLNDNPLGYWRLNETPDNGAGNNGAVAHDYRGGHNGYYSNTVNAAQGYNPASDADTAAIFGSLGIVNNLVADIKDVDFARASNSPTSFTIEAWVNGVDQPVDSAIVAKGYNGILNAGTGTGTEQFVLDVSGGAPRKFRFLVRGAAGNGHVAQSTITPLDSITAQPTWRHLVGVCDQPNGKVYLYVDGVLAASGDIGVSEGILSQPLPMTIGARRSSGTAEYDNQWQGSIDDVAVYGTALSPSQVLNHYLAAQRPPIITLSPTNQTTPENVSVTFTSSAYGAGTVGYQWYLSDGTSPTTPVAGQNSANLVFTTTAAQNGNYYQVIATNNYGSVTSAVAQLTVVAGAPSFFVDLPASDTFLRGHVIQLRVVAGGTAPFTYQWQKNGANVVENYRISGAQTPVLTIACAELADGGNYQVLVTNGQGTTPSTLDVVVVTNVATTAAPFNAAGTGWSLQGAPPMTANRLELTSGAGNTIRSAFLLDKQSIVSFNASFVYQTASGAGGADGATFCIQNAPAGAAAIGGGGGALGYGTITPSVALALNIYDPNTRGIRLLTNGTVTTPFIPIAPVLIGGNANPVAINVTYSGGILTANFRDTVTAATFTTNITVDIPAIVGSSTAFVGFTGADGGVASTQVISNFTMSPPPVTLNAQHTGNSLVLSWPSSSGACLKSTPSLTNPVWTDVTSQHQVIGNEVRVTVAPLPVVGDKFYRLVVYP